MRNALLTAVILGLRSVDLWRLGWWLRWAIVEELAYPFRQFLVACTIRNDGEVVLCISCQTELEDAGLAEVFRERAR